MDGKKSDIKEAKNQTKMAEKMTFTNQINGTYLDHVILSNGTGVHIAHQTYEILKKYNSTESLLSVHSDGCVIHCGHRKGAIRHLENILNRPLQYLICALHLCELVFEKLFKHIDGGLTGPDSYSGPIGAQISRKGGLQRAPMANFNPIVSQVPEVEEEYLNNNDVKKFYVMCQIIHNGPKNVTKAQMSSFQGHLGRVNSARWVTSCTNTLAYYAQTENPSDELILIVKIILNLYGPVLFSIKKNWQFFMGTKHYFKILTLSRDLLQTNYPELHNLVLSTLTTNFYYSHPESILCCMLFDSDEKINKQAIDVIIDVRNRQEKSQNKNVRQFRRPKDHQINFNATNYFNLVNFKDFTLKCFNSPPILSTMTVQQIKEKAFDPEILSLSCHSQSVEKAVYLTSLAAENVIGQEFRHSYVINKEKCVKKFKKSDCIQHIKKD